MYKIFVGQAIGAETISICLLEMISGKTYQFLTLPDHLEIDGVLIEFTSIHFC